jgi:hypothetical protein
VCQGRGPGRSCPARKIEGEQPRAEVRSIAEIVGVAPLNSFAPSPKHGRQRA